MKLSPIDALGTIVFYTIGGALLGAALGLVMPPFILYTAPGGALWSFFLAIRKISRGY